MNIHVWKNAVLFGGALALWMTLIAVELLTAYSGAVMQAAFGVALFALLITFWLVNRPALTTLPNPLLQFFCCGVLAFTLTVVFTVVAVLLGIQFRRLLESLV